VEELYHDNRDEYNHDMVTQKVCVMSEMEVKTVVQKLTINKATKNDNILAEFI